MSGTALNQCRTLARPKVENAAPGDRILQGIGSGHKVLG